MQLLEDYLRKHYPSQKSGAEYSIQAFCIAENSKEPEQELYRAGVSRFIKQGYMWCNRRKSIIRPEQTIWSRKTEG